MADFSRLPVCMTGPTDAQVDSFCLCADQNTDSRIDLNDYGRVQNDFLLAPTDTDADGVLDCQDLCPNTVPGIMVGQDGCPSNVCGQGSESCFASHVSAGCNEPICCHSVCAADAFCCESAWDETCAHRANEHCEGAPPIPPNNRCETPMVITDGTTPFDNTRATNDGPAETGACAGVRIGADLWFAYTATCTGVAIVSLCGSRFDTTLAVYYGSTCPADRAIACSDDDCLVLESRATLAVEHQQSYMIRVGGFSNNSPIPGQPQVATGQGDLTVRCNDQICEMVAGDCKTAHGGRGCDDAACCELVCGHDPACCDLVWDEVCAQIGAGLCGGNPIFEACLAEGRGACNQGGTVPGCDNPACCHAVCKSDVYCCVAVWDSACADRAATNEHCP